MLSHSDAARLGQSFLAADELSGLSIKLSDWSLPIWSQSRREMFGLLDGGLLAYQADENCWDAFQ